MTWFCLRRICSWGGATLGGQAGQLALVLLLPLWLCFSVLVVLVQTGACLVPCFVLGACWVWMLMLLAWLAWIANFSLVS